MFRNLLIIFCLSAFQNFCQAQISGQIVDGATKQPMEGATVKLIPTKLECITDANGRFTFKENFRISPKVISVNNIGYKTDTISIERLLKNKVVYLYQNEIELKNIIISANPADQFKVISKTDIAMRGVNNSQEILRIIPGMVIGQHQGGGKAEQIFLRGFDADHGTDFREDVDGLPINMPSHAHGQGFADSHFIIPETIEAVNFKKGPYNASKGDFNTTGAVDFITKNFLPDNVLKVEVGSFATYRCLGMFNLLPKKDIAKQQSLYVATEYRYSNAYFNNPQHFQRFNFFAKYNGKISSHTDISASTTAFWSKWSASGQIPQRAVDNGLISFFGAIDPNEGGLVYRTNANVQITTNIDNGSVLKNQLYFSNNHFDLHTNFTFFLSDTLNGDEIGQREKRNLFGYNGSFVRHSTKGETDITHEIGLNVRVDLTAPSELNHTEDRYTILNRVKFGNISELNLAPFLSETFKFNSHLTINAGLRFDQFNFRYNNKIVEDTTMRGIGIFKYKTNTLSPKLNIYYHLNDVTQFYFSSGKGFHSNDARVSVISNSPNVLPSAYGSDVGVIFKPFSKMIFNAAVWYIYLQQEYTYNGDGGDANFNNKTVRKGFDLTMRYQPLKALYFDFDFNYAHGRADGQPKGQDYIPLAPIYTSTGGLTYSPKKGINGSLRYRYVGERPGNISYSHITQGYFITDAVINYSRKKYELGIVVNNLFNIKWKETQFDTETRLKNEPAPVDEICFTPGTPLSMKVCLTYRF